MMDFGQGHNSGDGELMDLGNTLEAKPGGLADGVKEEDKSRMTPRF